MNQTRTLADISAEAHAHLAAAERLLTDLRDAGANDCSGRLRRSIDAIEQAIDEHAAFRADANFDIA